MCIRDSWMTLFEDVPYGELDDHGPKAPLPERSAEPDDDEPEETFEEALDRIHPLAHQPDPRFEDDEADDEGLDEEDYDA